MSFSCWFHRYVLYAIHGVCLNQGFLGTSFNFISLMKTVSMQFRALTVISFSGSEINSRLAATSRENMSTIMGCVV